ncbi:hypothetical protein [Streptomyces sp. NBC_00448]|jgi:hypothetical protein
MADDATFIAQYLSKIAADLKGIDLERERIWPGRAGEPYRGV